MSAPNRQAAALRGGLVGICAAASSVAARGLASGQLPSGGALVVVALAYVVLGALVGSVRLEGRLPHAAFLVAALCGCQLVGHLFFAFAGGHAHGAFHMPGQMLVAHGAAAVISGLSIGLAEHLFVVASTVLAWLTVFAVAALRHAPPVLPVAADPLVLRRVPLVSGKGTRAPPRAALAIS